MRGDITSKCDCCFRDVPPEDFGVCEACGRVICAKCWPDHEQECVG